MSLTSLLPLCLLAATPPAALTQIASSHPGTLAPSSREGRIQRVDEHGGRASALVEAPGARPVQPPGGIAALEEADWSFAGPDGGDVADVVASPTLEGVVLCGVFNSQGAGGLYRSTDGGASWLPVSDLAGIGTREIEFDSQGTAYLGTKDGVWRSADGGLSWTNLPLGIGINDEVLEVTIDPSDDSSIWVGVSSALGNQPSTLLHTTDGGASWTVKVPPGGPYRFTAIELDPVLPGTVYAAWGGDFSGGGVFLSSDGGVTWSDRSDGLPNRPMWDLVHDGTQLLVCGGIILGAQNVGVWSTTDGGLSWSELSDDGWPNLAITDLELDPVNTSRVLCTSLGGGLYESQDGGQNWSFGLGGTQGLSCRSVKLPGQGQPAVFLGTDSTAVWRSTSAILDFSSSSAGIRLLNVTSVSTNPLDADEIAVSFSSQNSGGVLTTIDGGQNWKTEVVPPTRWNTVAFDPAGTLYAISDGPTYTANEALYRRSGDDWSWIGPGQGPQFDTDLTTLAFDPEDPAVLYSGGKDANSVGNEATLWRSPDQGLTWDKVYEGVGLGFQFVTAISHSAAGPGVWVASYSKGALRSDDNGLTWSDSSAGLSLDTTGYDLALDSDGVTLLLADAAGGQGGGIFTSEDGGQIWNLVSLPGSIRGIVSHPYASGEVLTSHYFSPRVRASIDGGVTQLDHDAGLDPLAFVNDIYVTPGGDAYYVATNQGIWRTENPPGVAFCFGDGSAGTCACNNSSVQGEGCNNSTGVGATLSASGSPSQQIDSLVLEAAQLPPGQPGLFFGGQIQNGVVFGAGLRCTGGSIQRFPIQNASAAGTMEQGSIASLGGYLMGQTRSFQCWYRDPAGPCFSGGNFNLSNAYKVTFAP